MSYEKIPLKGMGEEAWLRLRKSGIGGSDAGAIIGVNEHSSPIKVYRSKVMDDIEVVSSESVRVGKDLEAYVCDRFTEDTGLKLRKSNYMYRRLEKPWMIADVDRLVVGEDAVFEAKTCSSFNEAAWKDGKIPPSYAAQLMHYMYVLNKPVGYIACLIMGRSFVWRKITWDETTDAIIKGIVEAEEYFWKEYVEKNKIPPVNGSENCSEEIYKLYPMARKGSEIELLGMDEKLDRRQTIIKEIESLQTEQNQIEQEVKLFLGDNEIAKNDRYKVTWSNVSSTRIDSKKLKEERPEIYSEFSRESSSRRFMVKAA